MRHSKLCGGKEFSYLKKILVSVSAVNLLKLKICQNRTATVPASIEAYPKMVTNGR